MSLVAVGDKDDLHADAAASPACRFMIGSSDSDSDDDKRVVRSAKDRRFDELKGTCEELRVRPCAFAACPCELARCMWRAC